MHFSIVLGRSEVSVSCTATSHQAKLESWSGLIEFIWSAPVVSKRPCFYQAGVTNVLAAALKI